MRILITLFLLIQIGLVEAQAQRTSYYHYDGKELTLSPESFRRYAKPQLKSMIREYYHVLTKMHHLHSELVDVKLKIQKLNGLSAGSKKLCSSFRSAETQINCQQSIKDSYKCSRELDSLILKLQSEKLKFSEGKTEEEISALFNLSHTLDEIQSQNYQVLHFLEENLITTGTSYSMYSNVGSKIPPLIKKMLLTSDEIITSLLGKVDKKIFDFIWSNFFKMLSYYVIDQENKDYLLKRLDELNIAWNTFNMKISKGAKKYPSKVTSVIKLMHNRWNSVLKIILR